jgi:outer membrane protein assembly factor BamB
MWSAKTAIVGCAVSVGLVAGAARAASASKPDAAALVQRLPMTRGLCVVLDAEPGPLAIALAGQSKMIVYVQHPDPRTVAAARDAAQRAGMLGTRIYVEKGDWSRLHLADNLADAVIVTPASAPAAQALRGELLRVVNPLGKVLLGDADLTKPFPPEADDWSHPYHGPDNNPLALDRLARAPYLTQFLSEPWYVPFPEVSVTSAGRVFKAFGHVGYKRRDWPWLNTLIALNGYNGTILWRRPLEEGFNIHRSTMIATPEILYLADSRSCKLLDAATGEPKGEIIAPPDATGPVWKWMALDDGVLYALVGEPEFRDATLRGTRTGAGWPWTPMTAGYDAKEFPWGFGRTLFAYDLAGGKVLWLETEEQRVDGRAVCMAGGRIYYYSPDSSLACREAKSGKLRWRNASRELLAAVGPLGRAQSWQSGFSTTAYLMCGDEAVYFAGPQCRQTVAVKADDGSLLWQQPDANMRLLLRDGRLYALGKTGPSRLFDPLSGELLAGLPALRGNCTRVTGSIDSVFARGDNHGGTLRLVAADNRPTRIALMRPDCHDGVLVANGLLYWGPWMCDCSLSLVGIVCLGPAGDFDFQAAAIEAQRLEQAAGTAKAAAAAEAKPPEADPGDWPAYRADNLRTAASPAELPARVVRAWRHRLPEGADAAAPVTARGTVYLSGSDGVVRAVRAGDGKPRWTACTGGPITFPPAYDAGRVLVGSGDGWVYAFDDLDGSLLWRFRAAPVERKIMLYGKLASTWPVASGVLVEDGVVYAAAGVASYDGTHVYALDAATGKIRWQNNASGGLGDDGGATGVSVQGHLLMHDGKLYLAGGNVVSPAAYDPEDGRCLSVLSDVWTKAPRGRDLTVLDGKVTAFDRLLYAPKEYWVGRYFANGVLQAASDEATVRASAGRVARVVPNSADAARPKALWQSDRFEEIPALAMGANAVVVAGRLPVASEADRASFEVAALSLDDGRPLWSERLPAMPVPWGLALDGHGRVVVACDNGQIACLAGRAE